MTECKQIRTSKVWETFTKLKTNNAVMCNRLTKGDVRKDIMAVTFSFPFCKLKGERERLCQLNCHVKKDCNFIFIIMVLK